VSPRVASATRMPALAPLPRSAWPACAALLGAAALLGLGIANVWPWISDDAFISLRYAVRLVAGDGLTWNDGDRVEGYSNLLWVLLTAGLHACGVDWVAAVRGLGIGSTLLVFAVLVRSAATSGARAHAAFGSVLILAAMAPIALLLTTLGFHATGTVLAERDERVGLRACRLAGGAFALLAWTRPDGPLWAAMACLAIVLFGRAGPAGERAVLRRRLLALGLPVLVAVVAQLVFRLAYYGDWVPNTAHVKVASSAATLAMGFDYLHQAWRTLRCLLVPAAVGALLALCDRRSRPFAVLCVVAVVVWSLYVATIGGDLFPLCRILLPALGPLALLAGLGMRLLARHGTPGVIAAWSLALAGIAVAQFDARRQPGPFEQRSQWEWQGRAVGEWLGGAFGEQAPLLALDPAGAVPFYSGLPCLDMLGLCDRHIAKAPLPRPDHVVPGHSRGDGAYVLDRAPDLVLFASPTGDVSPRWPGGWQMENDPRFLRDYRCVVFRTGMVPVVGAGEHDLAVTMWARLAGRIGVRQEGNAWIVPGWLLGAHRQQVPLHLHDPAAPRVEGEPGLLRAQAGLALQQWVTEQRAVGVLDTSGQGASGQGASGPGASGPGVVGEIRRAGAVVLQGLPVPAGDYELSLDPPTAGVTLALVREDGTVGERVDSGFRVVAGTGVNLQCVVAPGTPLPVRVAAVRLTPIVRR